MPPRDARLSAPATETFVPAISFTGYPDGQTAVRFLAGQEGPPVSPDYAALMRDKGLVAPPASAAETATDDAGSV